MGKLTGLKQVDAAIVGASLCGLLLGASLSDAGMKVAVIDAAEDFPPSDDRIATTLCPWAFERILNVHGHPAVQQYALALQTQLQTLLEAPPAYVRPRPVYTYARNPAEAHQLKAQQALYSSLPLPASIAPDAGGCPFPVELCLTAPGAAVDVSRWKAALRGSILRRGGMFYAGSRIINFDCTQVITEQGGIKAAHIVFTSGKPPGLQSESLLALLETRLLLRQQLTSPYPLHNCHQAVNEHGLCLIPSASGISICFDTGRAGTREQQKMLSSCEAALHTLLPDCRMNFIWYDQSVVSADGLPCIGNYPNGSILFASGYSGIPGAMHAAEVLTRKILLQPFVQDTLYAPTRAIPFSGRLPRLNAGFPLRRNAPRCSHCRDRLRYLPSPQVWACPRCGTSYSMLGQVLSGPGMRSASISIRQRPDI